MYGRCVNYKRDVGPTLQFIRKCLLKRSTSGEPAPLRIGVVWCEARELEGFALLIAFTYKRQEAA